MRLALTLAGLAALAAAASAEEPARPVASRIARVTVYEDRALVTREARSALVEGVNRVAFERLPPGLDETSLRARCGAARVMGVDLQRVHLEKASREAVQKARDEVEAAKRGAAAAEMELAEAKDRWDLLRSIRAKGLEGAERALGGGPQFDPKAIRDLLGLVDDEGAKARKSVLAATTAVETARAVLDAAQRRLRDVETGGDVEETRVVVTLEAGASGESDVTLQYMLGNASWRPVYDLRVDDDFGGASLGLTAVVAQRTGEDWAGATLEFTTAQPARGAAPPEPQPWRVWLPRPEPPSGFVGRAAPAESKRLRADLETGAVADAVEKLKEEKDAAFAPVTRASGVVVAFEARLPQTIESDGQPARVALARYDMTPDVRWVAFPRATDKVFVSAKMSNTTGGPLPGGETRVFVGPDFVGPMQLADWGVAKEIDVGLGVDRQVEVEREKLQDEKSTEGVFSKDTVHTRSFRLTLRNHRDRAVAVRLLDQVPVSNDEELEVEVTETSLAQAQLPEREAETNKARGVLEWRFDLAPKQATDVRFTFEVRHPKGRDVGGLGD